MGIDFEGLKDKAENLVKEHGEQIESGVEKAGEFVKQKFGHGDTVDKVVDKIQDMIPDEPRQQGGESGSK